MALCWCFSAQTVELDPLPLASSGPLPFMRLKLRQQHRQMSAVHSSCHQAASFVQSTGDWNNIREQNKACLLSGFGSSQTIYRHERHMEKFIKELCVHALHFMSLKSSASVILRSQKIILIRLNLKQTGMLLLQFNMFDTVTACKVKKKQQHFFLNNYVLYQLCVVQVTI